MVARITVYENGGSKHGKVIGVNFRYSMDDLLSKIGMAFKTIGYTRLFTSNGGEIMEVNLLRDEEVTYVSKGEDYISPDGSKEQDEDSKLVKLRFGGHSVFMTHSTLQSHTPVTIIMKCHGSELAIAYERDYEVAVDRAAAQTEGAQFESAGMDVDGVDAGAGFGPFPQEVIERILLELPTNDLLSSRLVSRIWKVIATSLCRGRHVQLRQCWYNAPNGLEIFSLFDLHNLPWSSYVFDDFKKSIPAIKQKFLEFFGPHLWEVKFGKWNFRYVLGVLRSSPNLQKLEFLTETSVYRIQLKKQVREFSLPKLKKLKLHMRNDDANVDFLQLLLHASNDVLESVEITFKDELGGSMAEALGRILRQVPHIGITMNSHRSTIGNFLTVLGEQFLAIRKFKLFLSEPKADGSNQVELFRPIERLLDRLDNLEELELGVIRDAGGFSTASFTFPHRMESLRTLNIDFAPFLSNLSMNFFSNILSTLQPDQVPMLEKVIISTPICYSYFRNPCNVTIFNSACRFDSVRVLKLEDLKKNYLKDDWSQVFPNLRSLDVKCNPHGLIAYDFTKMDHLEHLVLRMLDEDGVNDLLCGFPEPDEIYQLPEDVIKQLRLRSCYARPSLLNVTKLRSLEVETCWKTGGFLVDSVVSLSFLQMEPLQSLVLRGNVQLTKELELKLEERHSHVTICGPAFQKSLEEDDDEDW